MLLSKFLAIYRRIVFLIKYTLYRLFYLRKFGIDRPWLTCINSPFYIDLYEGEIEIGKRFSARRNLSIRLTKGNIKIGDNVFFNQGVSINCHKSISIGDDCLFGESVKLYDHNHCFSKSESVRKQGFSSSAIIIGENVWLGSDVIVLKGVTIGRNSVVSAGTVVDINVPANTILKRNGAFIEIVRS